MGPRTRRVPLAGGAGVFLPLADEHVRLALADANPLAHVEAHPDKRGNALSLGGRDVDEWRAALSAALALVARHLPGVHAEMRLAELLVIPVGYEPERHLSASYREYVGACYVTLHPRVTTLAEALVHEFQHGKANLASFHDPLLENGFGELVRSPVRPDPRPLWGVLLAAHAFVPVAELYLRLRDAGDASVAPRLAEVVARNGEALATLAAHARPTPVGRRMLDELGARHRMHAAAVPEGAAHATESWDGQ
jgi:HEXXH motif-containing protein